MAIQDVVYSEIRNLIFKSEFPTAAVDPQFGIITFFNNNNVTNHWMMFFKVVAIKGPHCLRILSCLIHHFVLSSSHQL
jgi:hypothetical protein